MYEATRGDGSPQERLISLLQADFTPPDKTALADRAKAENSALVGLLSQARSVEDIDARFESEENVELGEAVERLVEPAPVTESFKGFIAHEVRKAHAWQSRVDEVVAPDRLGLVSGGGIFDRAHAKDIEGQTLRGYFFDILNGYTLSPEEEDGDLPPLVLKPDVRPSDFVDAVNALVAWASDYEQTYGEAPSADLEPEAYLAAAPRARVMSQEEMEQDPRWKGILEILKQLEDRRQQG
jgi:hypothetical protein